MTTLLSLFLEVWFMAEDVDEEAVGQRDIILDVTAKTE